MKVLKPFLLLILVLLVMIFAMSAIIGMGYLLAAIFPLTLFQSSIVSIGTILIITFLGLGITVCVYFSDMARTLKESYEEEFEDDEFMDDDEFGDDEMSENLNRFDNRIVDSVNIGRNTPCPCGSGKKYKRCCGKH